MKKLLIAAALIAGATSAAQAACIVPNSSTPQVRDALERAGGWPISDAKCEFLRRNKLYVAVSAYSGVLAGASIGWANVMLLSEGNVRSDATFSSTQVNTSVVSSPKAEELMVEAIRNAIGGLKFEAAAREIANYERAGK